MSRSNVPCGRSTRESVMFPFGFDSTIITVFVSKYKGNLAPASARPSIWLTLKAQAQS